MLRLSFFITISFLMSCASTHYYTDRIPNSEVPTFSSYKVESYCDDAINPLHEIRLENAVNLALMERGLQRSESPDIYVQAYLKHNDKIYVSPCGRYDKWVGGEYCEIRYIEYEEGTLVIDLIEASNNKVFWHGAAVGNSFKNISDADERIQKIVERLFERYFKETGFDSAYANLN